MTIDKPSFARMALPFAIVSLVAALLGSVVTAFALGKLPFGRDPLDATFSRPDVLSRSHIGLRKTDAYLEVVTMQVATMEDGLTCAVSMPSGNVSCVRCGALTVSGPGKKVTCGDGEPAPPVSK